MESRISLTHVKPTDLHLDAVPRETKRAFLRLVNESILSRGWYLAGGTALTLQVGHRRSVDLDFFLPKQHFQENALEGKLLATGEWKTTLRQEGTIYGVFMGAKMSCIAYPFFHPSNKQIVCGAVRMLIPEDIAAMKIIAISQRGKKRDFIDLYWYCHNRESLQVVVKRAFKGYPGQSQNATHILKSLTFFDDADNDPMPDMYFSVSWKHIKAYFQKMTLEITKEILEIT